MVWRQFDFDCWECGERRGDLVWVPFGEDPQDDYDLDCTNCQTMTSHQRAVSPPALYTYDRPWAPVVMGGKFDTMGYRKLPDMPELPDNADFDAARDMFHSREYQEKRAARHAAMVENKVKRERAEAAKKDDTIDVRHYPCPGDPPEEHVGKNRRTVASTADKKPAKKKGPSKMWKKIAV